MDKRRNQSRLLDWREDSIKTRIETRKKPCKWALKGIEEKIPLKQGLKLLYTYEDNDGFEKLKRRFH